MSMFEWALAAAVVIWGLVISLRIARKGIPSLDDDRGTVLERIKGEEKLVLNDKKNISAEEQMNLTRAALRDLILLDGLHPESVMRIEKDGIVLEAAGKKWLIELIMNECQLKSVHRVLHGRCKWRVGGKKSNMVFDDIGELMKFLHQQLQGDENHAFQDDPVSRHLSGGRPDKDALRQSRSKGHNLQKISARRRRLF